MKIIVVYDDTGRKSEVITDIIGDKGFADVVVRKKRLEEYYKDELVKLYPDLRWKKIHSVYEYEDLIKELDIFRGDDVRIMHCFSNFLISDAREASLSFRKLEFVNEPFAALCKKRAVAAMFADVESYQHFCNNILSGSKAWDLVRQIKESFEIEGLVDIGVVSNFIQCVTGNFDSRYFNSLKENDYTLTKSSVNKAKIKAEYSFYHLLPEDMKYWFVMPFDYKEEGDMASYTMERLNMTDLSIKWVHGSMDEAEFESLMDKYFYFFNSRHEKKCDAVAYESIAKALYSDKVRERVEALKKCPEYKKILLLSEATNTPGLDNIVEKYFKLKEKIEKNVDKENVLVVGHGDPCFANALYNKSTCTLKFIDPKGALTEDELWTNPYYDVAKLSHSVCGRYDFFNNALFEIKVGADFGCELEIPFDNSRYIDIFRKKVEENGYDYNLVRLYEASLFISMLPLHIDNPHKVFGFILNAANILQEIEKNV